MKKMMFKHCTVLAAVFAVCLFIAGCNNPSAPEPSPSPAPAPAPSPAPAPAPSSPSIVVPPAVNPPVSPGATVQEEAIVDTTPVQGPTVQVHIKVKSVDIPTTATQVYGVVPRYAEEKTYILSVPKSIIDNNALRVKKMRDLLDYRFKQEGITDYRLYNQANYDAAGGDLAPDTFFKKNNKGIPATDIGTVYIAQYKTRITVDSVDKMSANDTGAKWTKVETINANAGGLDFGGATPPKYVPLKNSFPLKNKILHFEVWNTDDVATRMQRVKEHLDAVLAKAFGTGGTAAGNHDYEICNTAAITTAANDILTVAKFATGSGNLYDGSVTEVKVYIAVKEKKIPKNVTVKSISGDVTVGSNTYKPVGTGPLTVWLARYYDTTWKDITTATTAANVQNGLSYLLTQVDTQANLANTTNYMFFIVENPAGAASPASTQLDGYNLEDVDTIYIGKKP